MHPPQRAWNVRSVSVTYDLQETHDFSILLNLTARAGSRYIDGIWKGPASAGKRQLVQFDNATHGT